MTGMWTRDGAKQVVFGALRRADAGPVPINFARDHGYPGGTDGYVTDNDWTAFRAEAVLDVLSRVTDKERADEA